MLDNESRNFPSSSYVLLVNSRQDKGFDLIVDVAARCPDIPFLAIASQSDKELANEEILKHNVSNIFIIDKIEDMKDVYRNSKIVAVPSYKFKETFSRVCIEAHRFSKPVIGSTEGNVPFLLEESGIILPEIVDAWVEEIKRIYNDHQYYDELIRKAEENSKRYSQDLQRKSVFRLLDTLKSSILVGVGSGIGNILHCAPMIRNIANRLGRPIDVVVAGDYTGTLFLLHNENYVSSSYHISKDIIQKPYDKVFLTNSFGTAGVRFNSQNIIRSRDWRVFTPGVSEHETIFNLESARELMGVEYSVDDITNTYISDIIYNWNGGNVIGIHAGSKKGYWASKRWEFFEELSSRLSDFGFRIRSFGTSDEHVVGTEDATGGGIEEMARKMTHCAYFISNDSGLMNIANALGIPLLAIFGPTDAPTRRPLGRWSRVVSAEGACVPCEVTNRDVFKSGFCKCINTISVDDIIFAFNQLRFELTGLTLKYPI